MATSITTTTTVTAITVLCRSETRDPLNTATNFTGRRCTIRTDTRRREDIGRFQY